MVTLIREYSVWPRALDFISIMVSSADVKMLCFRNKDHNFSFNYSFIFHKGNFWGSFYLILLINFGSNTIHELPLKDSLSFYPLLFLQSNFFLFHQEKKKKDLGMAKVDVQFYIYILKISVHCILKYIINQILQSLWFIKALVPNRIHFHCSIILLDVIA